MLTQSSLIAMTGAIVLTFCTCASFVSSFLVKCGNGLDVILRSVFRQSSSFNWCKLRLGRAFCSSDSSKRIEINVWVQLGAVVSTLARICFSPQVRTTGSEGPPASAIEITVIRSSVSVGSAWDVTVADALHSYLVIRFALSSTMHSDVAWPVRSQLTQNVTVPCIGRSAGKISMFLPCGLERHVRSSASCCADFWSRSIKGQSAWATKCDRSSELKHALGGCCR